MISNIPQLVRKFRDDNDLTQADLAAMVRAALAEQGVDDSKFDHTFISRIENNKDASRLDLGTVYKLKLVIDTIDTGNLAIEVEDE